jgi:hypothetical protein
MAKKYIEDLDDFKSALLRLEATPPIKNDDTALLFDRLTYVIFGIGIMPQNNISIESIDVLERLAELYLQVKDLRGEWLFYPDVQNVINNMYSMVKETLPLKVGIKKAAKLLRDQLANDPFRNGIELGLISNIMSLDKTPYLKQNLPYYSRLGLWHHSNMVVNEEQQLLSDSFYFLTLAKDQYNKMFTYKEQLPKIKTELHRNEITYINANVCSFCRNCIVSFYAFFEGYVNSLGLNYLFFNKDLLSPEDIYALQGKDRVGNHYLKIGMKIECLQRIIVHKIIYPTNNPQQLKDSTFITLLEKMKEKRDVAMHYSKIKGEIMFSPQEWMDEAILISNLIIDASRKIWNTCFPSTDHFPYYLRELDYDYLVNEAQKRIVEVRPQ